MQAAYKSSSNSNVADNLMFGTHAPSHHPSIKNKGKFNLNTKEEIPPHELLGKP